MVRFKKAFVGVLEKAGSTYNIQEAFNIEGFFGNKITPLGANLCLMEEETKRALKSLIEEEKEWIYHGGSPRLNHGRQRCGIMKGLLG